VIVVGLTGSIAMGKTETAKLFESMGVPVFDSDAEVHRQYSRGGAGVAAVADLFPGAVVDGAVDRGRLSQAVLGDSQALQKLEAAIHPLVRAGQTAFLSRCRREGCPIAVLDIPLLFETGREAEVDRIVVASAPAGLQRERALARPGMTEEKFSQILAHQTPDADKRARADYVVDTSQGIESAAREVRAIIADLTRGGKH
jgi:dephospho-CoA kinase